MAPFVMASSPQVMDARHILTCGVYASHHCETLRDAIPLRVSPHFTLAKRYEDCRLPFGDDSQSPAGTVPSRFTTLATTSLKKSLNRSWLRLLISSLILAEEYRTQGDIYEIHDCQVDGGFLARVAVAEPQYPPEEGTRDGFPGEVPLDQGSRHPICGDDRAAADRHKRVGDIAADESTQR